MTAPSTTALGTPTGIKLKDGYSTRLAFSLNSSIELWVKSIQPPALDGGDMIDQTTMHNNQWHTGAARSLIMMGQATMKCAYDPNTYTSLLSLLNAKTGSVTYQFPDGSTLSVWGYLAKAEYQEMTEGSQPEVNITINHTNADPTGLEAGPVYVNIAGT